MPLTPGDQDFSQWPGVVSITGMVLIFGGLGRLVWCLIPSGHGGALVLGLGCGLLPVHAALKIDLVAASGFLPLGFPV